MQNKKAPLEGENGKAPPAAEKERAGFEEAARLAGPPGTGKRFAATVWLARRRRKPVWLVFPNTLELSVI